MERMITVRMTRKLHAAIKELVHETRAASMNKMCVDILADACLKNDAAKKILTGPNIPEKFCEPL